MNECHFMYNVVGQWRKPVLLTFKAKSLQTLEMKNHICEHCVIIRSCVLPKHVAGSSPKHRKMS
jgi:hypothetical protein